MAFRAKKPSLAEKISSLVTAAPTVFGSDDENEETKARVVERYDESGSDEDAAGSNYRKRNVELLDQVDNRYKGKKVSRKDIYRNDVESESEANEDDEDETQNSDESDDNEAANSISEDEGSEIDGAKVALGSDSENSEVDAEEINSGSDTENSEDDAEEMNSGSGSEISEAEDEPSGSASEDDDSEIDEDNPLRRERKGQSTNFKHMSENNVRLDVEKGNCVREQLKIWENLLEMRIKLQKCLIASNKMPQSEIHRELKSNVRFANETNDSKNKLGELLDNLLEIRSCLIGNYPETKNLRSRGTKRKAEDNKKIEDPMDEEICSDTDEEMEKEASDESAAEAEDQPEKKKMKKRSLAEYEKILEEDHSIYRDYRNSVIQKWNDKTRVAAGTVNKGSSQAVVKQIEYLLSDKSKLLKRTRLKRSEYEIVGKAEIDTEDGRRTQEYDSEIYDDDDFYHQLLRELIEFKSSDITDPIQLSKQWIQLQNMRSKMKRKIDTRATKGRRVRYNVHTKLVNFMAPITVYDTWSDLAKNELYNSLFGKIKSVENTAPVKSAVGE